MNITVTLPVKGIVITNTHNMFGHHVSTEQWAVVMGKALPGGKAEVDVYVRRLDNSTVLSVDGPRWTEYLRNVTLACGVAPDDTAWCEALWRWLEVVYAGKYSGRTIRLVTLVKANEVDGARLTLPPNPFGV